MPGIKKRPSIVFVLLLGLLLLTGCESEADAWPRIAESGVLRVGLDPTFPPFALDEEGVLTGIDVDLAQALAGALGLEAQFTYFGYDGLYDALLTDQVDVLISALVIAPERTKDVAYSTPYFDAGLVLVAPEEVNSIGQMADMDGRTLAVELGSLAHVTALEWQGRLPGMTVQTYPSGEEALLAAQSGGAAAALVDSVSGRLFLRDTAGDQPLTYLSPPVVAEPYAAAVRIDDQELLDRINDALLQLEQTGTLEAIIQNHLGP
jgi:ABC-type amino acid transport substrate-binding protein